MNQKTRSTATPPANMPSAQEIFRLLAGGHFTPMTDDMRQGAAGAGPDARTLEHNGLLIIADCQDGEGFHFEAWEEDGTVWGIDAGTGAIDQLVAGMMGDNANA